MFKYHTEPSIALGLEKKENLSRGNSYVQRKMPHLWYPT